MDKRNKNRLLGTLIAIALLVLVLIAGVMFGVGGTKKTPPETDAQMPVPQSTAMPENLPDGTVIRNEGEAFFPSEKDWVYHFTYAYPHVAGDSYAALMVNDTYQMALDEMVQLVLPMFANEPAMRYDGKNEVIHDFVVKCNNGRFLSILQKKSQTRGDEGTFLSLESLTFDMSGEYQGESLTLRGVVMVGESTDQIAAALMPHIYEEFVKLQEKGICKQGANRETFEIEFSPAIHFYADENGNAVFYLPPSLMETPSFQTHVFVYSPEEIEKLL